MATYPITDLTEDDLGKRIWVIALDPNDDVEGVVVRPLSPYRVNDIGIDLAVSHNEYEPGDFLDGDRFEYVEPADAAE